MIKPLRSTGRFATAVMLAALLSGAAMAQPKVLKFIPQADLRILDPIATTAYITRNHGYKCTTRCSRWTRSSRSSRR